MNCRGAAACRARPRSSSELSSVRGIEYTRPTQFRIEALIGPAAVPSIMKICSVFGEPIRLSVIRNSG